jgi:hypothetical protein
VKKRVTRSKPCTPAGSTSGTLLKSVVSTRITSRRVTDHGEEFELPDAPCHDSDNSNNVELCPLYGSRDMEICEADTCLSHEEVMGSRQAEIRDDATCVSALCRVDSSVSMTACSLHDWELLDDPTVDYCHLFASAGRRQAKELSHALLVLSSFTMPPMFVLLRTLCLHLMKR